MSYFEQISEARALAAIYKASVGLAKYQNLQRMRRSGISVSDREFQRKFNGFYKVRGRSPEWFSNFYQIFFEAIEQDWSFEKILQEIHSRTGRVEASFASKIRATIDENSAVIDSFVLQNLRLQLPKLGDPQRLHKVAVLYELLNQEMKELRSTDIGRFVEQQFFIVYPNCGITPIKALDLTIWQLRDD